MRSRLRTLGWNQDCRIVLQKAELKCFSRPCLYVRINLVRNSSVFPSCISPLVNHAHSELEVQASGDFSAPASSSRWSSHSMPTKFSLQYLSPCNSLRVMKISHVLLADWRCFMLNQPSFWASGMIARKTLVFSIIAPSATSRQARTQP